jgi:uncharacterized protein YndB with AHSA1/START domain
MIKTAALVVIVLVVALLAYAATRPDSMHVERSTVINAPPDRIFPLIADFHRWSSWSPYERMDPAMKKDYSGAASGRGAVYEWDGNRQVGQGRMEITDTADPSRVTIQLDFLKPFKGHNLARFELTPAGGSTDVTWTMDGASPFVAKVIGVFVNMDRMIGRDFETGLASLKALAENRDPAARPLQ